MKYNIAFDVVTDEMYPLVDDDNVLYEKSPSEIRLKADLNLSKIDLYNLARHLDQYLTIELKDSHIKLWVTVEDIIQDVIKYSKRK